MENILENYIKAASDFNEATIKLGEAIKNSVICTHSSEVSYSGLPNGILHGQWVEVTNRLKSLEVFKKELDIELTCNDWLKGINITTINDEEVIIYLKDIVISKIKNNSYFIPINKENVKIEGKCRILFLVDKNKFPYEIEDTDGLWKIDMRKQGIKNEQNHLVDGQFQYVKETIVKEKPKNNFKEYGFEADFEGEILIVKDDKYFGIAKSNESEGWVANGWKKDGTCLYDYVSHLKPIKKEWYKNPDNFPCIVISLKTNKPHIAYSYNHLEEKIKQETFSANPDKFRPATKEEVLSLLIKED